MSDIKMNSLLKSFKDMQLISELDVRRLGTSVAKNQLIPELMQLNVPAEAVASVIAEKVKLPLYCEDGQAEVRVSDDCVIKAKVAYVTNVFDSQLATNLLSQFDIESWGVLPYVSHSTDEMEYEEIAEEDASGYLQKVISKAVSVGASDIHIEPDVQSVTFKFRVDGALQLIDELSISHQSYPSLANCILKSANCTPGEYIQPKDGEFVWKKKNQPIQIRMSMVPAVVDSTIDHMGGYPGTFVLRLAGINKQLQNLDSLGLTETQLDVLQQVLKAPHGLFIITGPTGSGKTTSLYAIVRHLQNIRPNWSFRTAEDPVEVNLPGVTQTQINADANTGFAEVLKSLLRQDPDVIMVGEIRDHQTLSTAIEAAMTGHFVIATLHANSAIQAVHRLIQKGAEPDVLSDVLVATTAQRVVAALCSHCKTKVAYDDPEFPSVFKNGGGLQEVYKPNPEGCSECKDGYHQRVLLAEINVPKKAERKLISEQASTQVILESAVSNGFSPMWQQALEMIEDGVIDLEKAELALGELPEEVINSFQSSNRRNNNESIHAVNS